MAISVASSSSSTATAPAAPEMGGARTARPRSAARALGLTLMLVTSLGWGQVYTPPPGSAARVKGIDFRPVAPVPPVHAARFSECDARNTCDGQPLGVEGCQLDPNRNKGVFKLKDGVVFYEAKMAIDADGSAYALVNRPGETNQPETALNYPQPGQPSVDADRVPYIVMPLGSFGPDVGIEVGDVGAVVHNGQLVFAIVADLGPQCKIGEGSIELHELLNHSTCLKREVNGNCAQLDGKSIESEVMYFLFPGSKAELWEDLSPANVIGRIRRVGANRWLQMFGRP